MNDLLLFVSIAGYAAIAITALLLNDRAHRQAERAQKRQCQEALCTLMDRIDDLRSSNEQLVAERERLRELADLSEFEEVVEAAKRR